MGNGASRGIGRAIAIALVQSNQGTNNDSHATDVPQLGSTQFARQTGMAWAACHTVFPELTPFGRGFKLNHYVFDNIKQVTGIDTSARQTLAINSSPPISLMAQISYTHTSTALPDSAITVALAKDGDLAIPQQVSFFYAGKIADSLGAFVQLTCDGIEAHFGFDNTDIRYAHHWSFGACLGITTSRRSNWLVSIIASGGSAAPFGYFSTTGSTDSLRYATAQGAS
jgi:hypothetical protein